MRFGPCNRISLQFIRKNRLIFNKKGIQLSFYPQIRKIQNIGNEKANQIANFSRIFCGLWSGIHSKIC